MIQRHILLLDPNGGNRRNLAFLLHLAGYKVTEVAAVDEALNRLSLGEEAQRPDLLLVCESDSAVSLPEILPQLQQQRDRVLVVTQPQKASFQGQLPQILPSCLRTEVIETLARFWTTASGHSPLASHPGAPQESLR